MVSLFNRTNKYKKRLVKTLSGVVLILILIIFGSTCFARNCDTCGQPMEVFTTPTSNNESTHEIKYVCRNGSCRAHSVINTYNENHEFNYIAFGNNFHDVACEVCSYYKRKQSHTMDEYIADGNMYHYQSCSKCHFSTYLEDVRSTHADSNNDGLCDNCGYNMAVADNEGFYYKGSVQTFVAPETGIYSLEVWGASGGTGLAKDSYSDYNEAPGHGGKGGYAYGKIALTSGDTLYVVVGGHGTDGRSRVNSPGGWNGGGIGTEDRGRMTAGDGSSTTGDGYPDTGGGGGGATHIATTLRGTGLLTEYENYKSDVLIVAGGGGGSSYRASGGAGGGLLGEQTIGTGGYTVNQTEGYSFGQGMDGSGYGHNVGVGGGRRRLVWRIYQSCISS